MSRRHSFLHHPSCGFTLIELMVAMLLGLIVIAGVSSVFLANLRSYHTNEALSDVQSNARIAFELMARDIRQAGLTGCNSTGGRVANVLNNGPYGPDKATPDADNWWASFGRAVYGYAGDATDPAVTSGGGVAQRVAGTDSLVLIGAVGLGLSVEEDKEPAANFKLNEKTSDLKTGDIVIVCDPDHATIVQITDYNDSTVTVNHNTGGKVSPGDCSKGLGYPTECTTNGNSYTFGNNSSISKMAAHDWYIGNNPAGGQSLYRAALTNNGGTISTTAQEMVRNVTDMEILYHQANDDEYVPASRVANWNSVDAVRVTLTLESTDWRAGTDAKPLKRVFTSTTTVRNRVS